MKLQCIPSKMAIHVKLGILSHLGFCSDNLFLSDEIESKVSLEMQNNSTLKNHFLRQIRYKHAGLVEILVILKRNALSSTKLQKVSFFC